jgi:hypothetical protein
MATIDLRTFRRNETSQGGEDGILAAIFSHIGTTNKLAVEFGAYAMEKDSNVFPLWAREGWHAVLLEGDPLRARTLRSDYASLMAGPTPPNGRASIIEGFVNVTGSGSIDERLAELGESMEPDLVIIDVDGMDYHHFDHLRKARPRVVVCEFNPTIPAHLSVIGRAEGNYLGCSARALFELGRAKGYSLVACTLVNCIFVLDELAGDFEPRNELATMFDPFAVTYCMSAYDGSMFFSRRPRFISNVLSDRASHDLPPGTTFWTLRTGLGSSYLFTRAAYELIGKTAGPVATAGLGALRALRRRTGLKIFEPR